MLLNCSITVEAPPATLFTCVDAPQHIVGWAGGAVKHTCLSERGPQASIGRRFWQKLRQRRTIRTFEGEIIAWEQASHFGLRIPAAAYMTKAYFRVSPLGAEQPTLDDKINIALEAPLAKVLGPIVKLPLCRFVRQQIGSLKAYAEALRVRA